MVVEFSFFSLFFFNSLLPERREKEMRLRVLLLFTLDFYYLKE